MRVNQIISESPEGGTLLQLVHQASVRFSSRTWHKSLFNTLLFSDISRYAEAVATFLWSNQQLPDCRIYIEKKISNASFIVLLAAIKAGITITDIKASASNETSDFIFEGQKLKIGSNSFSLKQLIAKGKNALFYSFPHREKQDVVFLLNNGQSGSKPNAISNHEIYTSIQSSQDGSMIFYNRLLKCWLDGQTYQQLVASLKWKKDELEKSLVLS